MNQQKAKKRNEIQSNIFQQNNNNSLILDELSNDRITFSEDYTRKRTGSFKLIKGQFFKQFSFQDTSLKEYLNNEIKQMTRSSSAQTLDAKSHKSATIGKNKLVFSSDHFKSKKGDFYVDLSSPYEKFFASLIKKQKPKKRPRNLFLKSNNNLISKYKSNNTAFSQKAEKCLISNNNRYNNDTSYPCTTVRSHKCNNSNYNSNFSSNKKTRDKSKSQIKINEKTEENKPVRFKILVDLKNFM